MQLKSKTLALAFGSILAFSYPAVAQFYFPPASIFSPTANTFRGAGDIDAIQWLETHNASILAFLLSVNNFDGLLGENKEPLTVFVPTNEAFSKLSGEELKKLASRDNIERLLRYHLVSGIISESDIEKQEITTVEGSPVQITGKRSSDTVEAQLNGATVESTIGLNDKLVFVIVDEVLLPPDF